MCTLFFDLEQFVFLLKRNLVMSFNMVVPLFIICLVLSEKSTGAAFVGARCRTCCQPEGVFLSVNVDTKMWALTDSLDVTSSSSTYQSGSLDFVPNTWYTLTLSVIGTTANAWVNDQQVRFSKSNIMLITR
jgi:hypothetical protein